MEFFSYKCYDVTALQRCGVLRCSVVALLHYRVAALLCSRFERSRELKPGDGI